MLFSIPQSGAAQQARGIAVAIDRKRLYRLVRLMEAVRTVHPEMPAQMVSTFLWAAIQPRITMRELAERVGVSQSSMSRNVAALSPDGVVRAGAVYREGFGLVVTEDDPNDLRRKIVTLTARGTRLATQISEVE